MAKGPFSSILHCVSIKHTSHCMSSGSHINHGSHSFVSFLRLSIFARCCAGNMNGRNKEYEGDRRCAYVAHINNNTIRKESQSPISEVFARNCWRAGPGQEASDGSKVRREGKAGPFIPCEVRAQTGPARATTPAVARKHRWATTAIGARAKAYSLGQRYLRSDEDVCRLGGIFFHKLLAVTLNFGAQATTSAHGRQRLRPSNYVYARATTSGAYVHDQGWFCPSKLRI